MDIILQGKADGTEATNQMRNRFNTPVVYLTAYADDGIMNFQELK